MKAATAIGIVVAAVGILGSAFMEGLSPTAFINIPAIIIIMAGTGGVTMAAVGMERFKAIPALYKRAFSAEPQELGAFVTPAEAGVACGLLDAGAAPAGGPSGSSGITSGGGAEASPRRWCGGGRSRSARSRDVPRPGR